MAPSMLRFGRQVLWPSTLASQWYCELKTHLEHAHPEVATRWSAIHDGEAAHDAVASVGVPTPTEVIESYLKTGKSVQVFEWILEAERAGILVRGKPDLIDVSKRKARVAYELKFSRSDSIWPSQEVQAKIYGWLLHANGFATDQLVTAIVLFPPLAREGDLRSLGATKPAAVERLATDGMLDALAKRIQQERSRLLKSGDKVSLFAHEDATIQLARYDHDDAQSKLDWALEYWRSARDPLPVTRMPGKCRARPMNAADLCSTALAPPGDWFQIERDETQVIVTRTH